MMDPKMMKLMQGMKAKMSEMSAMMDEVMGGGEKPEGMEESSSALEQTFAGQEKPGFGGMKKMVLILALLFSFGGKAMAYTEIDASREAAFSSALSVSTTPVLFVSSATLLNLEEMQVWQYGSDVVYINFTLPASSTTAAATGIKIFQSDKNDGFLSLLVNKFVRVYFTLAGNSGTGSVRIAEFGRQP